MFPSTHAISFIVHILQFGDDYSVANYSRVFNFANNEDYNSVLQKIAVCKLVRILLSVRLSDLKEQGILYNIVQILRFFCFLRRATSHRIPTAKIRWITPFSSIKI